MKGFSRFVVKHRVGIIIVAVLLLIPAFFGYVGTYVNYDILTYLPSELDSMVGQSYLEDDFNLASTAMITVEHMPTPQLLELKEEIGKVQGVSKVLWQDDLLDVTIPPEILPEKIRSVYYNGDATLLLVTFENPGASKETMSAIKEVETILKDKAFIGGLSAIVQDTKELTNRELPVYTTVAVLLSLAVLFLGLQSTLVPLIFLVGIGFAILYNMGTNIFLGQVSYITQALTAVLQLGVSMDFSIFLLHRYDERVADGLGSEDAMVTAIQETFRSIVGSSTTTIAGFLAMCTMSLALGTDIGVVMAKGVVLSVLTTVVVLPALILFFDKPIHRHTHRTFIPKMDRSAEFVVRHRKWMPVIFLVLLIPFAVAQSKTQVYYTLADSLPADMPAVMGTQKLKDEFDMTTTHFVMVSNALPASEQREIAKEIEALPGVNGVLSYDGLVGEGIPESFLPDSVRSIFAQGGKKMLVVNTTYGAATAELKKQLEAMDGIIKGHDPSAVIAGEGAMTKDLVEIADRDFQKVSITSIVLVFLIIALVFKSISLPFILVCTIELAIMVNMGIPYFTGTVIPFVASIVIGTIQLGATIDYAILMTTRFQQERRGGLDPVQAATVSLKTCSQSIITSGLTFFAANIGVALISKIQLIQGLCEMIARGALISMCVILFLLPNILIYSSKVIEKTSIGWLGSRRKQRKEACECEKAN